MTYESFDTLLLTAASKLGSSAFNSPRAGSSRIVVEPLNPMPSAKHLQAVNYGTRLPYQKMFCPPWKPKARRQ